MVKIQFNSGRRYGPYGQRIIATQVDGKTFFVDIDRGIDGEIVDNCTLTEAAIMTAYDNGRWHPTNNPIKRKLVWKD
jgi:hypothetical protein